MDDEVRTRFKEVFEAIRQEFKIVFPNMFGGGKAELVLTEPTDLLKTGIEIEVQPPGKTAKSKFAFWRRTSTYSQRALFYYPCLFCSVLHLR